jgi:hypothetical protein
MTETTQTSTFASRRVYQRVIPLLIMSAISAWLIVDYFLPVDPVTKKNAIAPVSQNLLAMNSTVMLMTQLFGTVTLLLWRARSAIRRVGNRKNVFSSIMFMGWYIFYIALGFYDPSKLNNGTVFTLFFQASVGILSTTAAGVKFLHHTFWTFRLFASVATYESAVLFIVWAITFLRNASLGTLIVPQLAFVGDWVELYAFAAASRALLLSTAVGACIIAARALVMKEPGLIDMEMV